MVRYIIKCLTSKYSNVMKVWNLPNCMLTICPCVYILHTHWPTYIRVTHSHTWIYTGLLTYSNIDIWAYMYRSTLSIYHNLYIILVNRSFVCIVSYIIDGKYIIKCLTSKYSNIMKVYMKSSKLHVYHLSLYYITHALAYIHIWNALTYTNIQGLLTYIEI